MMGLLVVRLLALGILLLPGMRKKPVKLVLLLISLLLMGIIRVQLLVLGIMLLELIPQLVLPGIRMVPLVY